MMLYSALMIAIIDYGAGNLRSVAKAIEHLGYRAVITEQPGEVARADAAILPGVGSAGDTVKGLSRLGLVGPIREIVATGKPLLAVCVGMQVLLTGSEEGGWHDCLDIVPGVVRRLPASLKVPHMGWNQVKQLANHWIFAGIPDEANFYFVHSYFVDPNDRSVVFGETEYGIRFCSVLAKGSVVATQFHPEKSGELGLMVYDNFCRWAGASRIR